MNRRATTSRRDTGFTIVELLIVIAIIIILVSLLIVAVNAATRNAQRANTAALMTNISSALDHFRTEIGYLPPVLGPADACPTYTIPTNSFRDLMAIPQPGPTGAFSSAEIQDWYSITSLAEYLLGYAGEIEHQGALVAGGDGADGLGLRNPGPDGAWGAGASGGCWQFRNPPIRGKVYGPYLQLDADRLVAAIVGVDANGVPQLAFPGEGNYIADAPKVIVDYWGQPIRYYRQVYRPGFLSSPWRDPNNPSAIAPTLADVVLLRPWEFKVGTDTDSPVADTAGDTAATFSLKTAEFSLFSSSVDKKFDATRRRDVNEFNKDNIVIGGGS